MRSSQSFGRRLALLTVFASAVATAPLILIGGSSAAAAGQPTVAGRLMSSFADVRLSVGDRNADVKSVQELLVSLGYDLPGGADGVFGALTSRAVMAFQRDNRLATDGVVGPNTARALDNAAAKSPVAAQPASDTAAAPTSGTASADLVGLKQGSTGPGVKLIQGVLLHNGYTISGGADGVFGASTASVLRKFQASNGIAATGAVDAKTAKILSQLAEKAAPAATPASSNTQSSSSQPSQSNQSSESNLSGLKVGALGSDVKSLQQKLIDSGIAVSGGADGIFGPATYQAVREFQSRHGLVVDGVVGPNTLAALNGAPSTPAKNSAASSSAGGFASYGEVGARVRALQAALIGAGVTVRGGADGVFGGATSSAVMTFQGQNGLAVTGKVDEATANKLNLTAQAEPSQAAATTTAVSFSVFPVQGWCGFTDTWHQTRGGGRVHLGTDVIASKGQLVYAVTDGKIDKVYSTSSDRLAGNGVRLRTADGTYYFYAHFDRIADGIGLGVPVKAGQIIGYVGMTGNAGTPHLHFEVHPRGGAAIDPYPLLKQIDACNVTEPLPQP